MAIYNKIMGLKLILSPLIILIMLSIQNSFAGAQEDLIDYLKAPSTSNYRRLIRLVRRNPDVDVNASYRWKTIFSLLLAPCNERFNRNEREVPLCRIQKAMADVLLRRTNLDLSSMRGINYLTQAIESTNKTMVRWLLDREVELSYGHIKQLINWNKQELYPILVPKISREMFFQLGNHNRSILYSTVSANNLQLTRALLTRMQELNITIQECERHYNEMTSNRVSFKPLSILTAAVKRPTSDEQESTILEMINLLLEHGAEPDVRDFMGQYILFKAVENCWYSQAQALLAGGANPNVGGRFYHSPLHIALARKDMELAQSLMDHGARQEFRRTQRRHAIRPRACSDSR